MMTDNAAADKIIADINDPALTEAYAVLGNQVLVDLKNKIAQDLGKEMARHFDLLQMGGATIPQASFVMILAYSSVLASIIETTRKSLPTLGEYLRQYVRWRATKEGEDA